MTVLFGCLIGGYTLVESLGAENRPHPENRTERKEAGLLGPTPHFEAIMWSSTWAEVAPK